MVQLIISLLVLLVLSQESCDSQAVTDQVLEAGEVITVDNGGVLGEWGSAELCPSGTYAAGFSLLVEDYQGPGVFSDDTALNGIRLFCSNPYGISSVTYINSDLGIWGNWTKVKWCPSGPLMAFQLMVEPPQGVRDDTGANNIRFRCDSLILQGDGMDFGKWGSWSDKCKAGICGIQTKQQIPQNLGDDTALNDVSFVCCSK